MSEALHLPEYAGSLLRGQLGASLRRVSCMTGAPQCAGCPLSGSCPYALVFEAPAPREHRLQQFSHIPNPYVVEPPTGGARVVVEGECLQFGVVLVGRALAQLPVVHCALQHAFNEGLERDRARGSMECVEWQSGTAGDKGWQTIWQPGQSRLSPHRPLLTLPQTESVTSMRFDIATPMRLQCQGRALQPCEFTPRKLVADLLRRLTLLADFHTDVAPQFDAHSLVRHADTLTHEGELRWQDWSRYSSRQRRRMTLGGIVGSWSLHGDLAPLYPWLWLGQWLHVGKNATMGMGGYTFRH